MNSATPANQPRRRGPKRRPLSFTVQVRRQTVEEEDQFYVVLDAFLLELVQQQVSRQGEKKCDIQDCGADRL